MQALKITISGSYNTANRNVVDFENVSGTIPFVSEAKASQCVRNRYAFEWVRNARAITKDGETEKIIYKERIGQMRQVFIDEIEPVDYHFSYVGTDIKKMTYDELTDLATAKDLIAIPLPKGLSGVDLREMRTLAYLAYAKEVKGHIFSKFGTPIRGEDGQTIYRTYTRNNPPPKCADETADRDGNKTFVFNFAKLPALIVDGDVRINQEEGLTNEEMIAREMQPSTLAEGGGGEDKRVPSLEILKAMAVEKGFVPHHRNTYESLYQKVYGKLPDGRQG